ncbi:hypothetical protein MRB53_039903 [Persea americana]|nr:hypothetical protein MRB53_039903 [Persea americana]
MIALLSRCPYFTLAKTDRKTQDARGRPGATAYERDIATAEEQYGHLGEQQRSTRAGGLAGEQGWSLRDWRRRRIRGRRRRRAAAAAGGAGA